MISPLAVTFAGKNNTGQGVHVRWDNTLRGCALYDRRFLICSTKRLRSFEYSSI
jgi:hypothetical protein